MGKTGVEHGKEGKYLVFILFFDDRYFRWAPPLIESIVINEPEERVCVYGIGLAESQVKELCSYSCVSYVPVALQKTEFIHRQRRDKKAARIIQRIASFFLESFYRFPEEKLYMILDVDSLVVNPLTKIKREMENHDMGISVSRGSMQIRTGFVLVSPTEASKELVKDWDSLLMEGPCHWGKGQFTLFRLYQERENEMRFLEFGIPYRDPASNRESYIWSAYKTKFGSKANRYERYGKKLKKMKRISERLVVEKNTMSTHVPVLKAVLECFEPTGILELGAGGESTPVFYEYGKKLVSIETDELWFSKIGKMLEPRKDFELIYHDIGHGIHRKSRGILKEIINDCMLFYSKVLSEHAELNLLFIDHVTGLRASVLTKLFDRFDFVLYHDAEHSGYHYREFDKVDSSDYHRLMFKSFKVWTGILIHKKYEDRLNEFDALLLKYGTEFCGTLGIPYKHDVKKWS